MIFNNPVSMSADLGLWDTFVRLRPPPEPELLNKLKLSFLKAPSLHHCLPQQNPGCAPESQAAHRSQTNTATGRSIIISNNKPGSINGSSQGVTCAVQSSVEIGQAVLQSTTPLLTLMHHPNPQILSSVTIGRGQITGQVKGDLQSTLSY